MKNNRLHIVLVFCGIVLSTLLMDSCKSKKQEIPPFIEVHLDVKDENNQPIDSATVYLYDSKEAFDAAYANSLKLIYNSTGATLTTTIVNGAIDLKDLPSNKEYWVLVHDASEPFLIGGQDLGYKIDKDNSEANYKIDGFQNGTIVTATIKLSPVTSLVKFSDGTGITNFSKVEIAGDPVANFSPNDYRRVRKGDVSYMARTDACVWTGSIEAVGGKVVTEPLVACNYRMIIFTLDFVPKTGELIAVYVGQNSSKALANLSARAMSDTVYLDNNSVSSYYAETLVGSVRKCIFQGEIPTGSIVQVPLKDNCR